MLQLPDFPWDSLQPYAERARAHPGGIVDLSVGSPVDPVPVVIREALSAATDAHAYPLTAGSVALRQAIIDWYARRRGVEGLGQANVLPTIGSKEFIAGLPLWLGIGPGDVVVQPTTAYPTYALGAALVGARVHTGDDPAGWPDETRLVWLNSPGNPDGRILGVDQLAAAADDVSVPQNCCQLTTERGSAPRSASSGPLKVHRPLLARNASCNAVKSLCPTSASG